MADNAFLRRAQTALLAALFAAALETVLERMAFARAGVLGGSGWEATGRVALLFGSAAAPMAIALWILARLLRPADRRFAVRRLLLAFVVLVAGVPVAVILARGGGVARAGLGPLVRFGVPLAAALSAIPLAALAARISGGKELYARLLAAGTALVLRIVNAAVFPGLYDSLHDVLFVAEFLLVATALRPRSGRGGALALVLVLAATWGVVRTSPSEAARAAIGRAGFHAPRLERALRLLRQDEVDVGAIDRSRAEAVIRWRDTAKAARAAFAERLPAAADYNILWLSVDALRPDALGCLRGAKPGPATPNLDALAAEGAVFEAAYAQYPSTAFSVGSMFLGRYPTATPHYRAMTGTTDPEETARYASAVLAANGFTTAASIAFTTQWMIQPLFRGLLDTFEVVNHGRTGAAALDGEHFVDSAIATTDLLAAKRRRFFLWVHLFDPHHPYTVRSGFSTSGDESRAKYDGEVAYADREIGRLLAHLKAKGLWEKTVVLLNSDHGEAFGEHGVAYHGTQLYDEQVRIPLIVRVPGLAPQRLATLAENVDLYETVLDLAGVADRPESQGTSLLPLLLEPSSAAAFPDFAYAELPQSVDEVDKKNQNVFMLRAGRSKAIRHADERYTELYDLAADPHEGRDQAATASAAAAARLAEIDGLRAWCRDFGRSGTVAAEDVVAALKQALNSADPFARQGAIFSIRDRNLRAFGDDLDLIAASAAEEPEIRTAALRVLVGWKDERGKALAVRLSEGDDPYYRRLGLRELNEWGVAALNAASHRALRPFEGGEARRQAVPLAVEFEADLARAVVFGESGPSLKAALEDGGTAEFSRRAERAVAEALTNREPSGGFEIRGLSAPLVDRALARLIADLAERPLRDQKAILGAVERRFGRVVWVDAARRIAGNRYLAPELKDEFLARLPAMDASTRREFATHLAAGWDPAFHERVKAALADSFGADEIAALTVEKGRLTELDDLWDTEKWGDYAREAARFVDTARSTALALETAVRGAHAALAAAQSDVAAGLVVRAKALAAELEAERGPARESDAAVEARALENYDVAKGPLSEKAPITLRLVASNDGRAATAAALGRPEGLLVGEALAIDVLLRNQGDRALPAGRFPRGGRLRALWTNSAGETLYREVVPLRRALLPGEERTESIRVTAPGEPGRWTGRIIVLQYPDTRFHWVESPAGSFAIDVSAAPEARLDRNPRWTASSIESAFVADGSLEGFGRIGATAPLTAVPTAYRSGFTLKEPLVGDGKEHVLDLEFRWLSSFPGAEQIALRLEALGPATAPIETVVPMPAAADADGIRRATVALPGFDGSKRLRIEIGFRPGILTLYSLACRLP